MDSERLEQLIASYVDRSLDAAGEEELLHALEESAEARRALADSLVVAGMLRQAASPPLEADRIMQVVARKPGGAFADGVMQRIEGQSPRRRRRSGRRRSPWPAVAAIVSVAAAAFLLMRLQPADEATPVARDESVAAFGRLVGTVEFRAAGGATWRPAAEAGRLRPGDAVRTVDGRVSLVCDSGSALRLDRYTSVSLAEVAPPRFVLDEGELYVTVATVDAGLAIETPQGHVVDLGTRFGVRASRGGTTVVVEHGRVDASTDAGTAAVRTGERVDLVSRVAPPGEVTSAPEAVRALAWATEDEDALPGRTVPRSLGMQVKRRTDGTAHIEGIAGLGFAFVRRGIYWRDIEKRRGVYDFTTIDRLMDDLRARRLRAVCCLVSNNDLYEGGSGIRTDAGRAGFAAFASALATRYRGRGVVWEIWNEPNIGGFWGDHDKSNSDVFADEYAALVRTVAPAMHRADPECCVVAGAVSALWKASFEWTERCFDRGILASGIDGWSVHPYGTGTPEEHLEGYATVRELLAAHGAPDLPLLNTTRGFTASASQEARREAAFFVRQYMIDLTADVRVSIWYQWWARDAERQPAAVACRVMVDRLKGFRLLRRLETKSADEYLLLFARKPDEQTIVAWTSRDGGAATPREIVLPLRVRAGRIRICDVDGKESSAAATDGELRIVVTGAPRYYSLPRPEPNGGTP